VVSTLVEEEEDVTITLTRGWKPPSFMRGSVNF
jgi:hypothetical protein